MIWYELLLPVYKQGDDLAHVLNKHVGNVPVAFLEQAWCYSTAANTLSAIAHHPRAKELKIAAMSHSITVDGPADLLEELAAKELIRRCSDDPVAAVFEQRDDGWHYCDENYPEEGFCGPFETREKAAEHAASGGYVDGHMDKECCGTPGCLVCGGLPKEGFTAKDLGESAIAALRDAPIKRFEPELTPVPPRSQKKDKPES